MSAEATSPRAFSVTILLLGFVGFAATLVEWATRVGGPGPLWIAAVLLLTAAAVGAGVRLRRAARGTELAPHVDLAVVLALALAGALALA